jgi:hypothetical protein
MDRLENVLNAYASADETGRLHLFLAHRELREQFIRIDLNELSIEAKKRAARPARRWLDRLYANLEAI